VKTNKITIFSILLPLIVVAVFFYVQGSNSAKAKIEPIKQKSVAIAPIDDTKWFKMAFQNADKALQDELKKTPLNTDASSNSKSDYIEVYQMAILYKDYVIAGFAKEKLAQLDQTDSSYLQAGNLFMEQSTLTEDQEYQIYLLSKAKQLYQESVKINPNSIIANNSLAVAIIQLGQDPPMVGIGYIKKSLEIDSNDFGTNYLYGQMLLMSTQYEKAIKVYNKLVNLQPSNAGLYFTLSDIYGKTGDKELSKVYLEKAKTLNNK
jgi:tetratricopeptide (TPR) repeat protein